MKKYLILILLLLLSCQKDELVEIELPQEYEFIFKEVESNVLDNQDINFELSSAEKHWLIISDIESKSVIAKESFISVVGINTRKIYTKSLPNKKLQLTLETSSEVLKSTYIIVN